MVSEELKTLLRSKKTEDRIRAVPKLLRLPDPERQTWLLEMLRDKVNYVAAQAAAGLAECADLNSAWTMLERFVYLTESGKQRDPGCHIRAHLAYIFGRLEYSPAAEALGVGIRTVQIEPVGGVPFDTAAHLRANCALALAQMRAPDALRDISLLLFDTSGNAIGEQTFRGDPRVKVEPRKAAAQAMVRLGDANALIPLTLRLTYPENELPEVLQECMLAVVDLEDPRALELLTPYLHHADAGLIAYAALMIARTRDPEAPLLIEEAILRLSGDPLSAAVLALSLLRTDEGRATLYRLAKHPREDIRRAVVETLADSPDDENLQQLQAIATSDKSSIIRNIAKRAITS